MGSSQVREGKCNLGRKVGLQVDDGVGSVVRSYSGLLKLYWRKDSHWCKESLPCMVISSSLLSWWRCTILH